MKTLFTAILITLCLSSLQAQQVVTVFVNGKKAGSVITKDEGEPVVLKLKKVKTTLLKSIMVNVAGGYMKSQAYKKDIDVTLGDSTLAGIGEDADKNGNFTFSKQLIKCLAAGNKIKLSLLLNPSNPKMMIPSRMVPLCYLVMK